MTLQLKLDASRNEIDVDGFFLANKQAATLGTAVARSKTDLHVSGSKTATDAFLTTKPSDVLLRLPESCKVVGDAVQVPGDLRVNVSTSRIALGIAGDVGTTLSGQGTVFLKDVVNATQNCRSATISCVYSSWANINAYVALSNAQFVETSVAEDGSATTRVLNPEFVDDEDVSAVLAQSEDVLQGIYDNSTNIRAVVKYAPAPPLSKPVMKVPVGLNGSTYDISCNVVDRPVSLSEGAFESMAKACITMELGMHEARIEAFKEETAQPSVQASKWSENVANAMATLVCFTIPYRLDGATTVSPTGLSMLQSEFWKAEPQRDTACFDDCEGSGTEIASLLYHASDVSRDEKLAKQFPFTAGFANALVHHAVGLSVLAANAGSADAAGAHGHANVAGHAIALAIPKATILNSKIMAVGASAGHGNEMSDKQKQHIKNVKAPFCDALYDDLDVSRMPKDEQEQVRDKEFLIESFLKNYDHILPLAMEGTSPVTSTKVHETNANERNEQARASASEKQLAQKLGPTLARTFTRLHIPPTASGPDHAFYKDFVEFLLPARRSSMFTSESLREMDQAACHYVFTSSSDVQTAGVNTVNLNSGNFSIVPLWKVGAESGSVIDVASKRALDDTMTRREGPKRLTERESAIYSSNVKVLKKVAQSKPKPDPASDTSDLTAIRQILTIAAMSHNSKGVQHLANALENTDAVRAVQVNFVPVSDVIVDAEGVDVGALVELRVYG